MPRSRMMPVIYILIGLAVVGLVMKLATDAMGLLTNLLIMVGIAAVLYFVLNHFLMKRRGGSSDEMKKYKQAVKQSKRKYKGDATSSKPNVKSTFTPSPVMNKKKRKTSAAHLRVIEGAKNKKKNRASS
ncbi:SA1362 family protein [Thalassobacillus devorans]|uniref:SA1362 family protein n=1 Tax=Thalassobacillus devorans TaxID=279813 RepID=UPI000490BC90|nr:SA1362 family protein [Thalassobacillus devorans]